MVFEFTMAGSCAFANVTEMVTSDATHIAKMLSECMGMTINSC